MADIVIIGAGLTGLSAAYHLEQLGCYNYLLFEKEATVGGLCRSVEQDGFTFDYTGHLLHISDAYFKSFIEQHVGFEHLNTIHRRSFIYSQERYTHYPYQINLHGLPADTIIECISEFVARKPLQRTPKSFKEWVLSHFGAGLGKHFFFPYQTKIFDYDIEQLSASWTGRFVPQTSLPEMLRGALTPPTESVGYNAQFFYPKQGGIEYWIKKLHELIKNPIRTHHAVQSIDTKNKIVYFSNGHAENYKTLITTMPLDFLLSHLHEKTNTSLFNAASRLLCNSVVNFNLGIQRPELSEKHWIYYPETEYPFYRIGFNHNFAESMAPRGCSSLYGEFSYLNKSPQFVEETLTRARQCTKKLFGLHDTEIATEKIIHIPRAYVIYNQWRDKNLPRIQEQLATYNIHSVGRYGAWKYSSMQEGLLDGKAIAEKILEYDTSIITPLSTTQKDKVL